MVRTVLGAVVAAVALGLHQVGGRGDGAPDGDVRQGEAGEPLAPDGSPAGPAGDRTGDDVPAAAPSEAEATPPVPSEIPPPPVH